MVQSAYIHIPFCKSKCGYCSFVSYTGSDSSLRKKYVEELILEIKVEYKSEDLKTLYFGGGTPSLTEPEDIKKIIQNISLLPDAEVTLEINPETVDKSRLTQYKKAGINRLSIGVQSFDDDILKAIGRIHTADKAIKTITDAKDAGLKNISLDFIYGLPSQSLQSFTNDLKTAVQLDIEHISLYGLKIEEGSKFFQNPPENIADDDLQADMYLAAIELLEQAGFKHYEISNFSKEGFESQHNLNYWNAKEYYGFGAAAHGYTNNTRYSNYCDLKNYFEKSSKKQYLHSQTKQEKLEEAIFLGFRKAEGINTNELNRNFDIDFEKEYKSILEKFTKTNHLLKTPSGYCLSNEGFLISNIILSNFISC